MAWRRTPLRASRSSLTASSRALCAAGPDDEFDLLIPSRTRADWLRHVASAPNLARPRGHDARERARRDARRRRQVRYAHGAWRRCAATVWRGAWPTRGNGGSSSGRWQRSKPDVVYLPTDVGGCPDSRSVGGAPSVVTMHDLRVISPDLGDPLFAAAHAQCVDRAAAVVTSWEDPRAEILRRYPRLEPRLFMVSFPSLLPANEGPRASREQPFLLYPASTLPHKNHVRLVQALAEVRNRHDVRLVCTGPPVEPTAGAVRRADHVSSASTTVSRCSASSPTMSSALCFGVAPESSSPRCGRRPVALSWKRSISASQSAARTSSRSAGRSMTTEPASHSSTRWTSETSRGRCLAILDEPERFTGTDQDAGARGLGGLPTWAEVGHAYLDVFRWAAAGADPHARPFERVGFEACSR